MPDDGIKVYRPTRELPEPPGNLSPAQQTDYMRMRLIESFVNEFVNGLPKDNVVSAMEFPRYCSFARQVWQYKDQIRDPAERDRRIELKVRHGSENLGLKESILRQLAAEVLRTELAMD